jgi:diamine N-acetyltransferase
MPRVRPATVDDVDFIVAAHDAPHARGLIHRPSLEMVREGLDRQDRAAFVVTDGTERVGVVVLGYEPQEPPLWIVEFRRLVMTSQGQGFGKFAVGWVIDWSFNHLGAHRIWLNVLQSNKRARRLYERAGFMFEGTWRDGFRAEDGRYSNLCFYGLLKTDHRETPLSEGLLKS